MLQQTHHLLGDGPMKWLWALWEPECLILESSGLRHLQDMSNVLPFLFDNIKSGQ